MTENSVKHTDKITYITHKVVSLYKQIMWNNDRQDNKNNANSVSELSR